MATHFWWNTGWNHFFVFSETSFWEIVVLKFLRVGSISPFSFLRFWPPKPQFLRPVSYKKRVVQPPTLLNQYLLAWAPFGLESKSISGRHCYRYKDWRYLGGGWRYFETKSIDESPLMLLSIIIQDNKNPYLNTYVAPNNTLQSALVVNICREF